MKKIIAVIASLFIVLTILVMPACSKSKTGTEIPVETTEQTAETTTRAPLKVHLGVSNATAVDENMMRKSGIAKWVDECRGVYVSKMTKDSVLDKTKFRPGDIIQAIDGRETNTLDDIYDILASHNPGDTVKISAFRLNLINGENEYFDVDVTFPDYVGSVETSGEQ
ncbi:MAG: PDZ domain-containing protein [Clostridia bacterium]|nr:PDZ domain-containing protein [Clostridia bacterium]